MRTVEEVRRIRLAVLAKEIGSYASINDKMGRTRTDSSLSQIANASKNSKGGTSKTMGSQTAREIELACGKERGWMDTDPDLWPFPRIDHSAVLAMSEADLHRIEGALLLTAAQIGVDLEKRRSA